MKEFFLDFLKLLANCATVICLVFVSYLFISNIYHHKEISYKTVYNFNENDDYKEYKKTMSNVNRKMKSVDYNSLSGTTNAKVIFDYYNICKTALNNGTFYRIQKNSSFTAKNIYDMNNEILSDYNNKCIFGVPYSIYRIGKTSKHSVDFDQTYELTQEKRNIIVDSAEYLTKTQLGNSSYSFTTDIARVSIYNKTANELGLTINNYKMIASILDDVADWYVSEYGGNV